MKDLKDIKGLTDAARLLAANHYDMTSQAIYDEFTILSHEYEILAVSGFLSALGNSNGSEELIKAIKECKDAMNQAEDSLEFHYLKFPTDL